MADLLTTIKGLFTTELASSVATRLGESDGSVQKAFGGIIPLVLSSLVQRAETPGGAQAVLDLSQQARQAIGGNLTSVSGLLGLLNNGGGLGSNWLSTLFGNSVESGTMASSLGNYAGVSPASASSLLNLAGPAILALLGQHATSNSLNGGGFATLLQSLKNQVLAMLPSGLSSLTSLLGLGVLGATVANMTGSVNTPPRPAATPIRPVVSEPESDKSGSRWPFILLALLAVAALLYFLRGCNKDTVTTTATTAAVADSTSRVSTDTARTLTEKAGAALDSTEAALKAGWAKLGALGELKLADGTVLNVPANGVENRLVAFINDKSKAVDKTTWFSLDRILFHTATEKLLPESQEQLDNIVAILKAYPAVKLKLGGYTDSRGDDAMNLKLSGERAASIKAKLEAMGVVANRLEAEGYGEQFPVGSNNTADGRQQNRRVDVRVTAK